eukprot:Selendium_serpulae@DN6023_c0_g1_i4.p8
MNEDWVPPEVVEAKSNPKNVFEDTAVVQFEHRMLAYSTLAIAAGTAWKASTLKVLPPIFRTAANWTFYTSVAQATLGIVALTHAVPVSLGVAHQALGVGTISAITFLMTVLRH